MKDLSEHLNKRVFEMPVIDQAIEKIRHMDRQNLLSYKPKPTANKDVLQFYMTYHQDLPKIMDIDDKDRSIILSSDKKPIMAFRRPKSLKDHLARARLKPDHIDDEPLGESTSSGKPRCQTCKTITLSQTATSPSGASVRLKGNTNCRAQNVVYLISCTKCGKQYVWETNGPLNIRMKGKRDNWRVSSGEHFCSSAWDGLRYFIVALPRPSI